MKEIKHTWDDREESFVPCDFCAIGKYEEEFKTKETRCNNCDYYIILYCLNNNIEN